MTQKDHWDKVYSEKPLEDTSWYQSAPTVSWQLMQELKIDKHAAICDVGGGDSLFVDFLLSQVFASVFDKIKCLGESHKTPWGKIQEFIYCAFSVPHENLA